MALLQPLFGFTLRQVLDDDLLARVDLEALGDMVGGVGGRVVKVVVNHFRDHSQTLPRALQRANDNAWNAFGVALAGDGWWDKGKRWFASGDAKGVREQVQLFLQDNPLPLEGQPAAFRTRCLAQYQRACQAKLFVLDTLSPGALGQDAARFARYTDRPSLIRGANAALADLTKQLQEEYGELAWLLQQPAADGVPLLVAVFTFFFHLEIETDKRLYQGLSFQYLRKLTAAQELAFAEFAKALTTMAAHGQRLEDLLTTGLEQLHQGQEQLRAGQQAQQVILEEIRAEVRQANDRKQRRGVSCANAGEEAFLRQALERFRQLPPELQSAHDRANLAACLGDAGLHDLAREEHEQAAKTAQQENNQALAAAEHFQAYRAACEKEQWPTALESLLRAAHLDAKYAPFDLHKHAAHPLAGKDGRYEIVEILGAGGFGTVFRCRDHYLNQREVAIKALHTAELARDLKEVFQEANVLMDLQHPAIIAVKDVGFADAHKQRPYLVMEYFPSKSLAVRLKQLGPMPVAEVLIIARRVAEALREAHNAQPRPIYHRDVKPDNVLVRKSGDQWLVKMIDFGLAVQSQAARKSILQPAERRSQQEQSYAGTLKYAPPEQKDELRANVGPYSDLYSFGKMCCEMLFGFPTLNRHTNPKTPPETRHWNRTKDPVPQALVDLLERCLHHAVEDRPQDAQEVLDVLDTVTDELDPAKQQQRAEAEAEQRRLEALARQRVEEELRQQGEQKLLERQLKALKQTEGKQFAKDNDLRQQFHLSDELAEHVRQQALTQWRKENPPKQVLQTYTIRDLDMVMCLIPPGRFQMGSPKDEAGRFDSEKQHWVDLTKPFFLAAHPVTRGQFRRFVQAKKYKVEGDWQNPGFKQDDDHPVVNVSYDDAEAFCQWLSEITGQTYLLPTEAQWEYSCRGRALSSGKSGKVEITTDPYHFGKTISPKQANYDDSKIGGTTKVGAYPESRNGFGLFDMHGNVWEWCRDWFGDYPEADRPENAISDPEGPSSGSERVIRGGSWSRIAGYCRSAYRLSYTPGYRYGTLGLRVSQGPSIS